MDCTRAKSKMEPYASDRLDPAEKAELEQHLATCEGCRLEVELVRAMGSSPAKTAKDDGDEWTIDRIFGTGASRAPETASASETTPAPGADAAPETAASAEPSAPSPPAAPPAPDEFERSTIRSDATAPADSGTPAPEPAPSEESLFEKVPTPPPPDPVADAPAAASADTIEAPDMPPASDSSLPAAAQAASPDSEASFADLKLESIQDSSTAAPTSATPA
ncbi:MAG: zf-HC2 domain-containing protein, partial [Hyphomicrobiales bacterium]